MPDDTSDTLDIPQTADEMRRRLNAAGFDYNPAPDDPFPTSAASAPTLTAAPAPATPSPAPAVPKVGVTPPASGTGGDDAASIKALLSGGSDDADAAEATDSTGAAATLSVNSPASPAKPTFAAPDADDMRAQYQRDETATNKALRSQGAQMTTDETGATHPARDAAGNVLYKAQVTNPLWRDPADGTAYRLSRDQYDNTHSFPIDQGEENVDYKVDAQTGEKYVTLPGTDGGSKKEIVGQDPYVPHFNALNDRLHQHDTNRQDTDLAVNEAENGVAGAGGLGSFPLTNLRSAHQDLSQRTAEAQGYAERTDEYIRRGGTLNPSQFTKLQEAQATLAQVGPQVSALGDEIGTRESAITQSRQQRDAISAARAGTLVVRRQIEAARQDDDAPLVKNLADVQSGQSIDPAWARRYAANGLLDGDATSGYRVSDAGKTLLPQSPRSGPSVDPHAASVDPVTPSPEASIAQSPQSASTAADQPQNAVSATPAVPAFTPTAPDQPKPVQPFTGKDAPYRVDDQGNLSFDPTRLSDGLLAANRAGLVDDGSIKRLLPQALQAEEAAKRQQDAVNELQEKERSAGNYAPAKAAVFGAAKAGGFLAASAPGAATGAEIGSLLGPVGAGAGGIIGGLITGTLGSMAVDKTTRALAAHSDTIKSFTDASDIHPYYDAAGNLLAFSAGLPKVATTALAKGASTLADTLAAGSKLGTTGAEVADTINATRTATAAGAPLLDEAGNAVNVGLRDRAAKVLADTAGHYEAGTGSLQDTARNLARQAQLQAAGGASALDIAKTITGQVAKSAGQMVVVDTAIKELMYQTGFSNERQTLGGAAQAGLIGAFLSGHRIEIPNHSPDVVASVVARGRAAEAAGADVEHVLGKAGAEIYRTADAKIRQHFEATGEADPDVSVGQALQHGQPLGVAAAKIVPREDSVGSPASEPPEPPATSPAGPTAPASPALVPPASSSPDASLPPDDVPTPPTSGPASSTGRPSPSATNPAAPGQASTARVEQAEPAGPVPAEPTPTSLAGSTRPADTGAYNTGATQEQPATGTPPVASEASPRAENSTNPQNVSVLPEPTAAEPVIRGGTRDRAAAASWLASEREAGRDPNTAEVAKQFGLHPVVAEQVIDAHDRAQEETTTRAATTPAMESAQAAADERERWSKPDGAATFPEQRPAGTGMYQAADEGAARPGAAPTRAADGLAVGDQVDIARNGVLHEISEDRGAKVELKGPSGKKLTVDRSRALRAKVADAPAPEAVPAGQVSAREKNASVAPSKPVTVPRQPGDTEGVAVARERLADQRRMGKSPTVREVQKLGRISPEDAQRVHDDQARAEADAAKAPPAPARASEPAGDELPRDVDLDAEDRARREYEAELLAQGREAEEATGPELLKAVADFGGVNPDDPTFKGEVRNLRDASKPAAQAGIPGVFNIFRKNAGSLDQLTSHLRSLGFPVETPADTLDLLQQRLTQRKPIHGSYAREEAQDGMQHAGAYYRRQEKGAPTTPEDLKAQANGWRSFLQKVAPKTALRLEVIRKAQLDQLYKGQGRAPDDVQAVYLDRTIYLVHEALAANPDHVSVVNLLHEASHAYERTLTGAQRTTLRAQWKAEVQSKRGPLFNADGTPRQGIDERALDLSKPENFSEYFAERLAWENNEWAQNRATSNTPFRGFADRFRQLVQRIHDVIRPAGKALTPEENSARFRDWLTRGAPEESNAGHDGQPAQAGIRDWFRGKRQPGPEEAGRKASKGVNLSREDVAPQAVDLDPVTGTRSWLLAAGKNDGGTGGAMDAVSPPDGRDHGATGLEGGARSDAGQRTGAVAGGGDQQQRGLDQSARARGLAVKSYVAHVATEAVDVGSSGQRGDGAAAGTLEKRASSLLKLTPAQARENGFSPKAIAALERIREQIPLLSRDRLIQSIDADHASNWHHSDESFSTAEGGQSRVEHHLKTRTLDALFGNTSGGPLRDHLAGLAARQKASGVKPRLELIGVGNEGAAFRDRESGMIYKFHPGTESASAYGITRIEPQPDGTTHIAVEKVPLTEAIRRYERQNLVSAAIPTEVAGVTPEGILVTKQHEMATHPETTIPEIEKMMQNAGGVRVKEPANRKNNVQTWAVPDGEGNWMVAADLKPANVLRDRATGEPKLTDGILAAITPGVLKDNPQLAEHPATNPEAQFARRRSPADDDSDRPTLRTGEKSTGDLFQGEDQPFNLAGETAIDHGARQAVREQAERESAEARARQDQDQGTLFAADPEETLPASGPINAEHAEGAARRQIDANATMLKSLGVRDIHFGESKAGSGVEFRADGRLTIDPAKLARSLAAVRDRQQAKGIEGTPEDWFRQVLAHEGIHAADAAVAHAKGQTIQERYEALPDEAMPAGWEKTGRRVHGSKNWDALEPWQQKAEFVRQVVEGKWTGRVTEQLYKFVREAINHLKSVAGFEDADPRFQAHVAEVEARLEATRPERVSHFNASDRPNVATGREWLADQRRDGRQPTSTELVQKRAYAKQPVRVEEARAILADQARAEDMHTLAAGRPEDYRPATDDERKTLRIPPAWTDVHVAHDPNARRVAVGRDAKGRIQSRYSTAHTSEQQSAKFDRLHQFDGALPGIMARVRQSLATGNGREEAAVLRLIHKTGFRNGGDADTGARVKAFGASNLRAEHVRFEGDTTHFDFTGKLGMRQEHSITDQELTRDLRQRAAKGGALFDTSDARVRDYLKQSGDFKVHDFRTWNASNLAAHEVENSPVPRDAQTFWDERDRIGDLAAKKLGDTRRIALESYVDPTVFEPWKNALGITDETRPTTRKTKAADRGRETAAAPDRPGQRATDAQSRGDEQLSGRSAAGTGESEVRSPGGLTDAREPQFARRTSGEAEAEEKTPTTYEGVQGEKINRLRTAFAPGSGTLGIARSDMPQIASEHRGAMANFFNALGMKVTESEIRPRDLKPSQADFNPGKVERAGEIARRQAENGEAPRRILHSNDGYAIDGHHQWLHKLETAPDEPMPALKIDAPAKDILARVHEFPSAGMEKALDIGQRVAVPRQEGDGEVTAKAREWIADQREQGKQPTAKDVTRATYLPPDRAQRALDDQARAEAEADRIPDGPQAASRRSFAERREQNKQEDAISKHFDAVDDMAGRSSRQAKSQVRLDLQDARDRQAAGALAQAGFDRAKLTQDLARVQGGADKKLAARYAPTYQHALDHFDRLNTAAKGYRDILADQDAHAQRAGLPPREVFPDLGRTAADKIAAGEDPKSIDLADMVERHVHDTQRAVNERLFQRGLADAKGSDGKPLLDSIGNGRTAPRKVPEGYRVVQAGSNVLTVHKEIAPLLEALYGQDDWQNHFLGKHLVDFAAFAKHGTVGIFDTYHGARQAMKGFLGFGTVGWDKGLAALDYTDADLPRAVKAGEISQVEADYAKKVRPVVDMLQQEGLLTGKVSDNLLEAARQHNLVERIPLLGHAITKVNDYVFHKIQRGVMTQAAVVAFERNQARFPEMSEREVARQSATEVNEFFGNLGHQGFLKSPNMQNAARVLFLAPQFAESMMRSEVRSYAQAAKVPVDLARGKGLRVGGMAQAMGGTVMAMLIGNQMLNLFTRGHPTWDNEEEGHKWDAWIPGGKHGFFFSPLSVAAEYTHALMKYTEGGQGVPDAVAHTVGNKLSGLGRAMKDLLNGTDWKGQPFATTGERLKAAAVDALPLPMPAGPFIEKDPKSLTGYGFNHQPGAVQKQLMAAVGLKVENAPSARSQVYKLADTFKPHSGAPQFHGPSTYGDLKHALENEDKKSVADEIERLVTAQGRTLKQVSSGVGWRADGTLNPEYFTRSKDGDLRMVDKLTPEQIHLYAQAQNEHATSAKIYRQVFNAQTDAWKRKVVLASVANERGNKGLAKTLGKPAGAELAPTR